MYFDDMFVSDRRHTFDEFGVKQSRSSCYTNALCLARYAEPITA